MCKTERDRANELETFVVLYEAAQRILSVLRCGPLGPPGIKGLQHELKAICQDNLEEHARQNAFPNRSL